MELTLSQCGPRVPQELVGKNTKLQLVEEGLSERPPGAPPWREAQILAAETVRLKDSHRMSGLSAGGQGMGASGGRCRPSGLEPRPDCPGC